MSDTQVAEQAAKLLTAGIKMLRDNKYKVNAVHVKWHSEDTFELFYNMEVTDVPADTVVH